MGSLTEASRYPALYRDEWIVIVEKPEGVLSHPNSQSLKGPDCAFEGRYDPDARRFDTPAGPLWLIHRLDQDTSGALMGAWDAETAAALRALMDANKIEKKYLALASGILPPSAKWRDRLVKQAGFNQVRSRVVPGAPNAELSYSIKKFYRRMGFSLIEIRLITGKTHQIRVQAAHRKIPLAGDPLYGDFALNRELKKHTGLRRLFLHAASLAFVHPRTGKPVRAESSLPPELSGCLSRLL